MADVLKDDEEQAGSSSYRRIWKRGRGPASSNLALKAMAVLYDAQRPLTRDELADQLLKRLDAYERDYLEAWALRRLEQQARWDAKRHGKGSSFINRLKKLETIKTVQRWITEVFAGRIHGGTLVRDPDGRFHPGADVPRIQTMDGKLMRYTPNTRKELEQADH